MHRRNVTHIVRLLLVAGAATVVATHVGAADADKPLLLRGVRSFYVGGRQGPESAGPTTRPIEGCKTVAAAHPDLKLTVDYLPDAGIRGNSHMMMLDRNNKQIADRIMRWIAHQLSAPAKRTR